MLEETKRKISLSRKGKYTGQGNPFFGKKHSEETKRKISLSHKGKPNLFKGKHHSEESKRNMSFSCKGRLSSFKGKTHSEEARKKMSEAHKGKTGEDSGNWKGGISFLPYPPIFNDELKQFIKDRDNNECQNPYCRGDSKRLTIHHIDHDKDNCSQFNLITLCNPCNGKDNGKHLWKRLYRKIVWSKYE